METCDRGPNQLEACEMCHQAQVRYVHVMEHDDFPERVAAGCICAGAMEGDPMRARERETNVKNRSQRRANWIRRKGWKPSGKGNPTIRIEGYQVTAFPHGNRWKWSIAVSGPSRPKFSPTSYASSEEAALAAFDEFEHLTGKS